MRFHIEDMVCGGCARGVIKAIHRIDAEARVTADPPNRVVEVQSSATREQIEAALREAGFPPRVG